MALEPIVTKEELGKLAEPFQKEYAEQKDGTFLLAVTPKAGFALENVEGLRGALESERTTRKAAEGRLKAMDGIDPVKAREALEKVEKMADYTPGEKVAELVRSREEQLSAKYEEQIKKLKADNTEYDGLVQTLMVENEAVRVLAGKEPGKPVGNPKLLLPHIKGVTKIEKTPEGRYVRKIIGPNGHPLLSRRQGAPADMDLEEYITDVMRKDTELQGAFYGSQQSGAGAGQPKRGDGDGRRRVSVAALSDGSVDIEKIASGEVEVDVEE